jgi:hypothetical protein
MYEKQANATAKTTPNDFNLSMTTNEAGKERERGTSKLVNSTTALQSAAFYLGNTTHSPRDASRSRIEGVGQDKKKHYHYTLHTVCYVLHTVHCALRAMH